VTAPAYTDVATVAARLRLEPTDPDYGWLTLCVEAANERVDEWLERGDEPLVDPFPAAVQVAAAGVAARVFRGKDATADLSESWAGITPLQVPRDALAGFTADLAPWRRSRGWAPA
jgi:hypothetical protein